MLWWEQVEREALAVLQGLTTATALSDPARLLDLPSIEVVREKFDESLVAAPTVVDRETFELRRALGLSA